MPIAHTFGPDGSGSGNPFSDDDDDDDKKSSSKNKNTSSNSNNSNDSSKKNSTDQEKGFPKEFYPPPLIPQLMQSPYPGMPPVAVMAPEIMLPDPEE